MTNDGNTNNLTMDKTAPDCRPGCRNGRLNEIMELITSWRHLFSAVLRLGADEGRIDQRLRDAYVECLKRISGNSGLPDYLQKEYEKLMSDLADLYSRSDIDMQGASRLAKRVVALYDRVSRELR